MMSVSPYLQDKKGDSIISIMNEAIKLDPDYSLAYYYRSYGYIVSYENEKYEADIQKAIELYPEFPEAYLSYGGYFMGIRNFEKAKDVIQKGLEFDPYNKLLNTNLKVINDQLNSSIMK